ncbi:C40 family peptidase [Deinococcus multiflagellatus]|uniref:C40 family peptidase n=1 Tax=Deinococcus multiflagellatus TaxID=1656887 RepID=A0ABW1ZMU6_9DEIO
MAETPSPLGPSADWRQAALALLNTPYLYGGTTPRGTDCSGFVLQVFTPLGVSLPRTSADQARAGQEVDPDDLQPGDLVFFDTEGRGRVTHVGIYLGEDQFVSANSYQGRVTVDTLRADRYWGPRYLLARRILNSPLASR